jgi:hypothetical protein
MLTSGLAKMKLLDLHIISKLEFPQVSHKMAVFITIIALMMEAASTTLHGATDHKSHLHTRRVGT